VASPASPSRPPNATPAAPAARVALAELAPGDAGVIARVEGDDGIARRLLDLGFIPGTRVTLVRRAPLGDPISFELRGARICLRRSEAARIHVEPAARRSGGS
jgi:ferrous iron transport protein A